MEFDPCKQLEAGAVLLATLMKAHGFSFAVEDAGVGSGGCFARGRYSRGNRSLELHYRYGLGIVCYHIGAYSLGHADYMRLLGKYRESEWVRVAMDKTLDGFHRLLHDLQNFCQDFLSGSGEEFRELAEKLARDPSMFSGFKALGR